jgi:hypothetical protein
MIPYHQFNRVSDLDKAMRGDTCQGKTPEQETRDSMTMLVMAIGWIGIVVAMTLLTMPWWFLWLFE